MDFSYFRSLAVKACAMEALKGNYVQLVDSSDERKAVYFTLWEVSGNTGRVNVNEVFNSFQGAKSITVEEYLLVPNTSGLSTNLLERQRTYQVDIIRSRPDGANPIESSNFNQAVELIEKRVKPYKQRLLEQLKLF